MQRFPARPAPRSFTCPHRLAAEWLEDRRLLSASALPDSEAYRHLVPAAVVSAQQMIARQSNNGHDLHALLEAEDDDESGPNVVRIELQVPQDLIPPSVPITLVEEVMEDLIEQSTPAHDVVDVILRQASVTTDARIANPVPLGPAAYSTAGLVVIPLRSIAAEAADLPVADEAIAPYSTDAVELTAAGPVGAVKATAEEVALAVAHEAAIVDAMPAESPKPPLGEVEPAAFVKASGDAEAPPSDLPAATALFARLRADLRLVHQAADCLLEQLRGLGDEVTGWLSLASLPRWAQLTLTGSLGMVAWHELRRWRERQARAEAEAVDWVLLCGLDGEGPPP